MMGLEEHLIGMFRHDFEFVDGHRSHLGDGPPATVAVPVADGPAAKVPAGEGALVWSADGEAELHNIPFFVRGKVRRNTETFALERGIALIDAETLHDAKAHFSR